MESVTHARYYEKIRRKAKSPHTISRKSLPSNVVYREFACKAGLLLLVLLLSLTELSAQGSGLQLTFRRQNNFTYATNLDVVYRLEREKYRMELDFHHDNLYNSRISADPFVQVFFRTNLWQFWRLKKGLSVASWIESDQFLNTSNQRYSVYGGFEYQWKDILSVTPLIGYSWDYRSQRLDQGLSPALRIASQYTWEDGLQMQTRALLRTKHITPRHQRNLSLLTQWSKKIDDIADFALGLRAGSNQMDNYNAGSVEQIKSDTLAPEINFRYRLAPALFWNSDNQFVFTRRQFDYTLFSAPKPEFNDLGFGQWEFFTRQKLSYAKGRFNSSFNYEYLYLNRRYEVENSMELNPVEFGRIEAREKQKDYLRKQTRLELFLAYQLNQRHSLSLNGRNRYLQYDTPAKDNFDDHDELTYDLALELRSRWSRAFSTRYKLLGNVRRYAFLFRERSQDNYTQRSLRAEFHFKWTALPQLTLNGSQFIYVTYNVKDFLDRNFTDRSTRNLESRFDARYRHSAKVNSEFSFYRKEIHVSYLNWQAFTETTLDTTQIYILEHKTGIQLKTPWKSTLLFLDMGYKHVSQTRYFNTSMTSLQNQFVPINLHTRSLQTGPQTGLRLRRKNPASLELNVWWQVQYQDNRYKQVDRLTNISSSFREDRLMEVVTDFRPFITMSLSWAL